MKISELIKQHMIEEKLSANEVRRRAKLGAGTMDGLLQRNANPTINNVVKIANVLHMDMNEFKQIDDWR